MIWIYTAHAGLLDSAPSMMDLVTGMVNAILGFAGGVAVLVIVIAGVMYVTSGGDTMRAEYAKKTMIGGIIGMVVVLGALGVVAAIHRIL